MVSRLGFFIIFVGISLRSHLANSPVGTPAWGGCDWHGARRITFHPLRVGGVECARRAPWSRLVRQWLLEMLATSALGVLLFCLDRLGWVFVLNVYGARVLICGWSLWRSAWFYI